MFTVFFLEFSAKHDPWQIMKLGRSRTRKLPINGEDGAEEMRLELFPLLFIFWTKLKTDLCANLRHKAF